MSHELIGSFVAKDDEERRSIIEALEQINVALNQGLVVRGFLSGRGMRVVRIEDAENGYRLKGYGEYPQIDFAFVHAGESFKEGITPYEQQYGGVGREGRHTFFTEGAQFVINPLDEWLLQGGKLKAVKKDECKIQVELRRIKNFAPPDEILIQAKEAGSGRTITYHERGYTYRLRYVFTQPWVR